jgi:hypothetical protein
MAGLRGDTVEPRADRGVVGEIEVALMGHMGVRKQADVGDRVLLGDEKRSGR